MCSNIPGRRTGKHTIHAVNLVSFLAAPSTLAFLAPPAARLAGVMLVPAGVAAFLAAACASNGALPAASSADHSAPSALPSSPNVRSGCSALRPARRDWLKSIWGEEVEEGSRESATLRSKSRTQSTTTPAHICGRRARDLGRRVGTVSLGNRRRPSLGLRRLARQRRAARLGGGRRGDQGEEGGLLGRRERGLCVPGRVMHREFCNTGRGCCAAHGHTP
jgi:hypothetical protein